MDIMEKYSNYFSSKLLTQIWAESNLIIFIRSTYEVSGMFMILEAALTKKFVYFDAFNSFKQPDLKLLSKHFMIPTSRNEYNDQSKNPANNHAGIRRLAQIFRKVREKMY